MEFFFCLSFFFFISRNCLAFFNHRKSFPCALVTVIYPLKGGNRTTSLDHRLQAKEDEH